MHYLSPVTCYTRFLFISDQSLRRFGNTIWIKRATEAFQLKAKGLTSPPNDAIIFHQFFERPWHGVVGPAGVWTQNLPLGRPLLSQLR